MNLKGNTEMKLFKLAKRYGAQLVVTAGTAMAVLPAHAAIDVTEVVAEIKATYAATGPIPLIGAAVLLVIVALAAFRWVRRAMS